MTTRLITRSNDVETITANVTTDARTAMARGLAEYLMQLDFQRDGQEIAGEGGRFLKIKKAYETFAEPEENAPFPSVAIDAEGEVSYSGNGDDGPLAPGVRERFADGRAWSVTSTAGVVLLGEFWSTDPVARRVLVKGLEDAMNPVDWMSGARLELPHYHGVRATYLLLSSRYTDDTDKATRRYRIAQFRVSVAMPTIRVFGKRPNLQVGFRVEATDGT
jgi:hypothetical protein